jgi:hypothetical protein
MFDELNQALEDALEDLVAAQSPAGNRRLAG